MSKTPEAEEGYVDFARLEEEIAGSSKESEGDGAMVAVCFTQSYNPASLFQRKTLLELADEGALSFCTLKFVDVDRNREACAELKLSSTPAMVFYWGKTRMSIDRPGADRDNKFVGAISKDSLIHLIRNVRTAGAAGQHSVVYDL